MVHSILSFNVILCEYSIDWNPFFYDFKKMASLYAKRLAKELKDLQTKPPVGIVLRDTQDSLLWYH